MKYTSYFKDCALEHKFRFIPGKRYRVIDTSTIFEFVHYDEDNSPIFKGIFNTEDYAKDHETGYYGFTTGNALEEIPGQS